MKTPFKMIAAFLFSMLLLTGIAVALPAEGVPVTGQPRPQGQTITQFSTEGAQRTAPAAGDFGEASRLGLLYTVKTASAGTSFTTAGVSPLAAAGIAWLAVYNPASSKYNLEIESVTIGLISGTPGVGAGAVYDLGCAQNITATPNATPVNHLDLSAGVASGFTQLALAGSTLLKEIGLSPYMPFAAAAAGVVNVSVTDVLHGRYIVAPGCVFAVQTTAAGTTHVAAGAITYRQAVP